MASGTWSNMGLGARVYRIAHAGFSVLQLTALAYVWSCAVRRRRDGLLTVSVTALLIEGVAVVAGRGDCPLAPLQDRLGDPVPLFELVLPQRAAKAAVPVLATIAIIGMAMLVVRPPRQHPRASSTAGKTLDPPT